MSLPDPSPARKPRRRAQRNARRAELADSPRINRIRHPDIALRVHSQQFPIIQTATRIRDAQRQVIRNRRQARLK